MLIENAFEVKAPPERVYSFLLDVNEVVACMPGAEMAEQVDPQTFKGRVRIKVGPVTVAYNGVARISERDDARRTAILEADGRETTAQGSARSRSAMAVEPSDTGSTVRISTEFTVAGRAAQFGRGLMEDISRRLVAQMADGIRERLEAAPAAAGGPAPQAPAKATAARPVNALSLLLSVLVARIRTTWF
ncbi:MAG TPA: SRPBCC family protein, partial [Candidatus Dormibacteraeota bacterium]